jgi:hypothetical protein
MDLIIKPKQLSNAFTSMMKEYSDLEHYERSYDYYAHEKGGYVDLDVVNYCVSVDDDYEDDNWILQYQVDPGDHGKKFKLPILRYSDYEYRLLIAMLGESIFEELLGKWFTETYGWPVNSVTPEQD